MDSVVMEDPPLTDNTLMFRHTDHREDRVELFRDSPGHSDQIQTLNLKVTDAKLEHIAKVFKVIPETLYLEEDITKNVEFPNQNGLFQFTNVFMVNKFKVCGDSVPRNQLPIKFIPISADDTTDVDYWKSSSRRFYLARSDEFTKLMKIIKKNRKPLKLRGKQTCHSAMAEEDEEQMDNIEGASTENYLLRSINNNLLKVLMHTIEVKEIAKNNISSMTMPLFECKICKDVPTNPIFVTCCQQVLGCQMCVQPWIQRHHTCPLCCSKKLQQYKIKGFDQLLVFLKGIRSPSNGNGSEEAQVIEETHGIEEPQGPSIGEPQGQSIEEPQGIDEE